MDEQTFNHLVVYAYQLYLTTHDFSSEPTMRTIAMVGQIAFYNLYAIRLVGLIEETYNSNLGDIHLD